MSCILGLKNPPKEGPNSNQNRGHLRSRYITYPGSPTTIFISSFMSHHFFKGFIIIQKEPPCLRWWLNSQVYTECIYIYNLVVDRFLPIFFHKYPWSNAMQNCFAVWNTDPQEQLIRRESPEIVLGFLEPKVTGEGGFTPWFFLRDGRLIYTFGFVFYFFWCFFFLRIVLFS